MVFLFFSLSWFSDILMMFFSWFGVLAPTKLRKTVEHFKTVLSNQFTWWAARASGLWTCVSSSSIKPHHVPDSMCFTGHRVAGDQFKLHPPDGLLRSLSSQRRYAWGCWPCLERLIEAHIKTHALITMENSSTSATSSRSCPLPSPNLSTPMLHACNRTQLRTAARGYTVPSTTHDVICCLCKKNAVVLQPHAFLVYWQPHCIA